MTNKIIDSHVHLGLTNVSSRVTDELSNFVLQMENNYNDQLLMMNSNGIEKAVVFGIPHKEIDADVSNQYILEAYNSNPDRFIPICRINKNLKENIRLGFKGAKVHLLYEGFITEDLKDYFRILENNDLPLIVHALFMDKPKQIEQILKYAPDLKIILAHMGRNEIYTSNGVIDTITKLAKYDNVYFETSTVGDTKAIEEAVKIVGADRIIYGSDYPFNKTWLEQNGKKYAADDELAIIKKADILEADKEKILYGNAKGLFK